MSREESQPEAPDGQAICLPTPELVVVAEPLVQATRDNNRAHGTFHLPAVVCRLLEKDLKSRLPLNPLKPETAIKEVVHVDPVLRLMQKQASELNDRSRIGELAREICTVG